MTESDFIEKVKRQNYLIDGIDSWRLVHFFTDKFGVKYYDKLTLEDELCLMWEKLTVERVVKKKCKGCGIEKDIINFSFNKKTKDGRTYKCKVCTNEYLRMRK